MDKEYRKALKKHLMKAFESHNMDFARKQQNTASPDLVQALFQTPSIISRSRIIDALIDIPVQTSRESFENSEKNMYYQYSSRKTDTNDTNISSRNQLKMCPPSKQLSKRMRGGDNTNLGCGDGPNKSQTNLSIYTFGSTHYSSRSKTPSFRRRTARELSNMVLAECKLVESLKLVESIHSENEREKEDLNLPIILWRSKRTKFSSSVDLRFDHSPTRTSKSQVKEPLSNERNPKINTSEKKSLTTDEDDDILDAESIIRKQFTGPLIRHVERNYVRNITATADLLKMLERMPGDIDRVLAKECSK